MWAPYFLDRCSIRGSRTGRSSWAMRGCAGGFLRSTLIARLYFLRLALAHTGHFFGRSELVEAIGLTSCWDGSAKSCALPRTVRYAAAQARRRRACPLKRLGLRVHFVGNSWPGQRLRTKVAQNNNNAQKTAHASAALCRGCRPSSLEQLKIGIRIVFIRFITDHPRCSCGLRRNALCSRKVQAVLHLHL
jgi:hypothetical protein